MLRIVHEEFISVVKEGRGKALKPTAEMFSGRIWEGKTARKMGLIDEFGSTSYVAREKIGAEKLIDFTRRQHWLDRFAGSLGASIGRAFASKMSEQGLQNLR